MRRAPLVALLAGFAVVVACSAKKDPPPHPSLIVDCQPPPVSSGSGRKCGGLCLQHDNCDGAAPQCPAGLIYEGVGDCPNSATCCSFPEGGIGDAGDAAAANDSGDAGDATLLD